MVNFPIRPSSTGFLGRVTPIGSLFLWGGREEGGRGGRGKGERGGRKGRRKEGRGREEGRGRGGDLYPNIPYDRMEGYGRADWKGGKRCLALNPSLYPIEGRKGRGKGKREEREGRAGREGRKGGREGDKGRGEGKGTKEGSIGRGVGEGTDGRGDAVHLPRWGTTKILTSEIASHRIYLFGGVFRISWFSNWFKNSLTRFIVTAILVNEISRSEGDAKWQQVYLENGSLVAASLHGTGWVKSSLRMRR